MRRLIVLLTIMAATLAALVVTFPAMAAFPGQNGRIAFMRQDADGFWQTWVANKDLSNRTKLTNESAHSAGAVWKPGGAKLAFDSGRADPDPTDSRAINDIFKMNPDGSGRVKLTHSGSFNADAGWSPSGSRIAFDSDRRNGAGRSEIFVMDADGSHVRRVSTLPEGALYDVAPRFSPDGKRLVFTRYRTDPGTSVLFTVRLDGSSLRRLTPWGNGAGDADWSPGGKKLVFEAYPNKRCFGEIYTVEADGQHLTNITDNRCRGGSADPVWSPDGKKILFLQAREFGGGFGIGLATMHPDGSARNFISPNPKEMHQPDWESIP
jgi:Tol biopolymer transport system component